MLPFIRVFDHFRFRTKRDMYYIKLLTGALKAILRNASPLKVLPSFQSKAQLLSLFYGGDSIETLIKLLLVPVGPQKKSNRA